MIALLALAVSIFVFTFIVVFSPFLDIKEVNLIDDRNCPKDPQSYIDENLIGKNILFTQTQDIASGFESEFTCIDKISIDKQIPTALILNITAKKPVAEIADSNLQISKDGLLLDVDSKLELPSISLNNTDRLTAGETIDDKIILKSLDIGDKLLKSDFVPDIIEVTSDNEILITSNKKIKVIFSPSIDSGLQVDSLQLILGKAKIDAEKIEKIDLRFEKPIVTYI